jgi:hypothetical protein
MPTTIARMRSWSVPASIPLNSRISPYETTVWVVSATLTDYKLEEDSDYHLVLRDELGNTIITEIAHPSCVGLGSPFAAGIANARQQFDARYTATEFFQFANVPVQVTGVGMFDFLHGQRGVAPNGIEIHPILDIWFDMNLQKPKIIKATLSGKKLTVLGLNFDEGAVILVNGQKQKTKNNSEDPTINLLAKKAGKKIERGVPVVLRVRNSDGTESDDFTFTR